MSGMTTWQQERRQDQLTRAHSADPCGRTALYRFYDKGGRLLYAGISNEPWRRRREHAYSQSWWPRVRHQAITWYDTEPDARKMETRAIKGERPAFNKAGAVKLSRRVKVRHDRCTIGTLALSVILWAVTIGPVLLHPALGRHPLMQALLLLSCAVSATSPLIALAPFAAPCVRRLGVWLEDIWIQPEAA